MRAIIDGKMYNTKTATMLAEYWNGLGTNDHRYLLEELYITKKGVFFLYGSGGALTGYSEIYCNQAMHSSRIIPMEKQDAYEWLERNGEIKVIEKYFSEMIEEA